MKVVKLGILTLGVLPFRQKYASKPRESCFSMLNQFIKEGNLWEMGFVPLKEGFYSIKMNFFLFYMTLKDWSYVEGAALCRWTQALFSSIWYEVCIPHRPTIRSSDKAKSIGWVTFKIGYLNWLLHYSISRTASCLEKV